MVMDKENRKKEILDAYHFRHATRQFDPRSSIPEDDFQFILETGRLSPSSNGLEPWKFLVVQNEELRAELREHAYGAYRQLDTASHFVVVLARKGLTYGSPYVIKQLTEVKGIPRDVFDGMADPWKMFFEDFQLQEEKAIFDWAAKQTYIAMGNMMTAAAMIGIDSCPIEGFAPAEIDRILDRHGLLGGGEFGVSAMIAFGYRAIEPRAKTRQTIDQVTRWIR